MLHVVANYRAKPGEADRVATLLAAHASRSRAEPGCLQFQVLRSTDDPDVFALVEAYVDEAAFQTHRMTPHFTQAIEQTVATLLSERVWRRYADLTAQT